MLTKVAPSSAPPGSVAACLFCASVRTAERFRAGDRWHEAPGVYTMRECLDCGLLFLDPQPAPEQLGAHYPARYYAFEGERAAARREEWFYRVFFGAESNVLLKAVCRPYKAMLRTMAGAAGDRLLDVGCGSGHFLAAARRVLQVDAYGVEPYGGDPELAAAHGLRIFRGTLEGAAFPPGFFDVITVNHVFEHVRHPRQTLAELARILRPGGTLILGLPQSQCLLFRLFGRNWLQLDVPRHMFVPSVENLRGVAEAAGFAVTGIRFNGTPAAIMGTLYYWWNDRPGRRKYYRDFRERRWIYAALLPLSGLLNLLRIGDQVELMLTIPAGDQYGGAAGGVRKENLR